MKRIHTTGKVILMGGLGVLLTLATAAPAGAQTATDVVCTGCVGSTDIADLGVASADLATGAVTGAKILDGTITAADLATGAVSSVKIADGAIVNADISAAAAIAGTKVAPNFGSQNVVTTGNAGVGTTSPSSRLDVVGALTVRGMAAPTAALAGQGRLYYDSTANKFKVSQNGAAYVDLLGGGGGSSQWTTSGTSIYYNTGNVGIGTTNPSQKLSFGSEYDQIRWPDALGVGGGIVGDDGNYKRLALFHGNQITFQTGTNSPNWNNTRLLINSAGNVGIGTTAPQRKLDIYDATAATMALSSSANGEGHLNFGTPADIDIGRIIYRLSTNQLGFGTNNRSDDVVIDSAGSVGIGTTAPDAKLDVRGTISSGGNDFYLGRYDGRNQGTTNSNRALVHSDWGIGTDNLVINFDGDFEGGVHIMGPKTIIDGSVGIGTTDPGAYKLAVKGKIHAEEVVVDTGWADFVFDKDYDLMPLEEVAQKIAEDGHLPGIPTAQEVEENGVSIGQIQSKLLQKIEEMTLYVIELKKDSELLKKENEALKERISSLENRPM